MIELSVVAPTFNEKDKVLQLTQRLGQALKDVVW
jgi:hypothetical protein